MSKIATAYGFYQKHIYDLEKIELLKKHHLKVAGSVPSVIWELFGALLTGREGAGNKGADLVGWEVKSAKEGGSYEYQYHLNTGLAKLKEDCRVNHLFCKYSETYKDVIVLAVQGDVLAKTYFKKWIPLYESNYDTTQPASQRRQRFRKNVTSGFVDTNGSLILKIEDGALVESKEEVLTSFNELRY